MHCWGLMVEFQAVMFVGPGNSLYPLTEEGFLCKPLVPVANKPLVFYTLEWLENGGFTDVTFITNQKLANRLTSALKLYSGHLNFEYFIVENFNGTVDALKRFEEADRIQVGSF